MPSTSDILLHVEEYFNRGDPKVRTWLLLRSYKYPVYTAIAYILAVKVIGPLLMKNRDAMNFRKIMVFYNFGLVAAYSGILLKGLTITPKLGLDIICQNLNAEKNPLAEEMFFLGYQLYILKYIELLDTIFLVAAKKFRMITPLHVIHHALVPIFGFIYYRTEKSSYISVFAAFNSTVHVIMYTYYGISALGPEFKKYVWWKKHLTLLQITQFLFIAVYVGVMGYMGCMTSMPTLFFVTIVCAFFFWLFLKYYMNTFTNQRQTLQNGYSVGDKKPKSG